MRACSASQSRPLRSIVRGEFSRDRVGSSKPTTPSPSRVYFHCGEVIVAVIDWAVEPLGPFRSTPENLYFATDDLDAAYQRATDAGARHLTPIERRPWA